MRATLAALLVLLLLVGSSTGASAARWSLGVGSVIENGNTRITMGKNFTFETVTFDAATGAVTLDGVTIHLSPGSGYGNWTLHEYNVGARAFHFNGTTTAAGTIQVRGPGKEYEILGRGPTVVVGGDSFRSVSVPAATYTSLTVRQAPSVGEVINENIASGLSGFLALLFAATVIGAVGFAFLMRDRRR